MFGGDPYPRSGFPNHGRILMTFGGQIGNTMSRKTGLTFGGDSDHIPGSNSGFWPNSALSECPSSLFMDLCVCEEDNYLQKIWMHFDEIWWTYW